MQVKVLRFFLRKSGRTISVCPDSLPPYRPLPLDRLEAEFDERSGIVVEAPSAPLSVAEEGSLKRAWRQFGQRLEALGLYCGQHLPAVIDSARELWLGLQSPRTHACRRDTVVPVDFFSPGRRLVEVAVIGGT